MKNRLSISAALILTIAIASTCLLLVKPTLAGEFNATINIGDEAPVWEGLDAVDGEKHASVELNDREAIVVVFTCNSCPYAVDMEDRLIEMHSWCDAKNVALVAINVNTIESDALPMMKVRAEEKKFKFPYLYDPTQVIAKGFGARYTPEWFIIDRAGKIAYMGSLDDSPDGQSVAKTYVKDALTAILAGKVPDVTETVPIGCRIRYARVKRTRK